MIATPAQLAKLPDIELVRLHAKLSRELMPVMADSYPTATFVPNTVQVKCLDMLQNGLNSNQRKFGFIPGNGVGKTTLLMNLIWNIADGVQSQHFDYPFIKNWTFPKHLRLLCNAPELKDMRGAISQSIEQWWPRGKFKAYKQGYDYNSVYELPNGYILDINTYDQQMSFHESVTLGGAFFNEVPPLAIWQTYAARLRKGGFRCLFCTVYDDDGYWVQDEILEDDHASYVYGDLHECCRDCFPGTGGHMGHKEIEAVIADYPEEQREARKTGQFIGVTGKVFDVVPAVHFIPDDQVPPESTAYASLDPHPLRPWVYLVGKVDSEGNWYIVDEWPKEPYHKIKSDHRGVADFVDIIRQYDTRHGVYRRVIDRKGSAGNIRRDYGSSTLRNDLEVEHRLRFDDGNMHVEGEDGGVMVVKSHLRFDSQSPLDYRNRPRLYVSDSCWNLKYQLQNLSKEKDRMGHFTGELDEKFLDYPRALMYLLMAGYRHRPGEDDEVRQQRMTTNYEKTILKKLKDRNKSAMPLTWRN